LNHSQTKTLHNPSILKKQVMKGQPSSCNSQPTRVKFEIYLSMAEVEQWKKKIKALLPQGTASIHSFMSEQNFNHMI